ncbi:hypothetical protein P6P90_01750 [Ectobacillus antri]|jgi:hypothetical protein|uniref:Uncharacterized protein n=1 Tax=Ectobacillus antri TaxID=2486280 RepID=A0ABT6H0U0_9BACI|nr:hypothetical protein [Ectobacillus antri]MDG4656049.1 hypothetical protein [Ectobacillus antri]MDG5752724.1 hypothetical protein [Ectobacillus antri]
MQVKEIGGYELVKAQSNTSEDFFNRSFVTYVHNDKERTFFVLYLRYFEEQILQQADFSHILVLIKQYNLRLKETFALICLLKTSMLIERKRLYITTIDEFVSYLTEDSIDKAIRITADLQKI